MRKIQFLFFCFIAITSAFGQNAKAKDFYDKAIKLSNERKYEDALQLILKSIDKDSTFAESHFKAAQLFEMKQNQLKAFYHYQKAISIKPSEVLFNQANIYLGSRLFKNGEYQKAKKYLDQASKNLNPSTPVFKQVLRQLENCDFAIKAVGNPSIIFPKVVAGIENFAAYSYFPVLTADSKTLFFTARSDSGDENLFVSDLMNNKWQLPKSISKNINTPDNEGTCTVSADGRILVFTACDGPKSLGSCDLFVTKKIGEEWSKPENLGSNINSNAWESQPALSADGRILYFASDRNGGVGKKDIYVSYLEDSNVWTLAKNLGKTINTIYDEVSPFIHANGTTLFFASEGHVGLGGYDLFFTEIEDSKTNNFYHQSVWRKPENLGFPINNASDQIAMFISSDGKNAYYSYDDKKQTKLYQFEVPDDLFKRFKKVDYLKGTIQDAVSKKLIAASVELYDLKTNILIEKVFSDSQTGEFTAVLPNGSQFGLYINKERYFFKSLTFDYTAKSENSGKNVNILLEPIRTNVIETLNNLFFDSGKADLKPESDVELNKILMLLKNNSTIKIEISGHTDDVGSDQTNQILSQKRANSVIDFLKQKGIETNRLVALGYGESKPILPNLNEENRRFNRRIEMKIL